MWEPDVPTRLGHGVKTEEGGWGEGEERREGKGKERKEKEDRSCKSGSNLWQDANRKSEEEEEKRQLGRFEVSPGGRLFIHVTGGRAAFLSTFLLCILLIFYEHTMIYS